MARSSHSGKLTRKRSDRQETEHKLRAAALQLFSKDGFDGTSVHAIAKQSGINVSLINRYFGDKNGLLNSIAQEAFSKLYDRTVKYEAQKDASEELTHYARAEVESFAEDHALIGVLVQQSITNKDFRKKMRELTDKNKVDPFLLERLEKLQASGMIRTRIKTKDFQFGINFQIFSQILVAKLVLGLPDTELEGLLDLYVEMILEGKTKN